MCLNHYLNNFEYIARSQFNLNRILVCRSTRHTKRLKQNLFVSVDYLIFEFQWTWLSHNNTFCRSYILVKMVNLPLADMIHCSFHFWRFLTNKTKNYGHNFNSLSILKLLGLLWLGNEVSIEIYQSTRADDCKRNICFRLLLWCLSPQFPFEYGPAIRSRNGIKYRNKLNEL